MKLYHHNNPISELQDKYKTSNNQNEVLSMKEYRSLFQACHSPISEIGLPRDNGLKIIIVDAEDPGSSRGRSAKPIHLSPVVLICRMK